MTLEEVVNIYNKCQSYNSIKLCEMCILNTEVEDEQTLCGLLVDAEFFAERLNIEAGVGNV